MNWKIRYNKESNSDQCYHWAFYNICLYPYFYQDYERNVKDGMCREKDCPIRIKEEHENIT